MKKWWWVILLSVLGTLLTLGLLAVLTLTVAVRSCDALQPLDGPGMEYRIVVDEVEFVENDYRSGASYKITAKRGETVRVVLEYKGKTGAQTVRVETNADNDLMESIGLIVLKNGLERTGRKQERDPYVMPDVTTRLKVVEPDDTFTVSSLMELSKDEIEAVNEIVSLLKKAIADQTYALTLGEGMYGVDNAHERYPAGADVVLYYGWIATDTDYAFYLDGEPVSYEIDDYSGIVLSFTMPDHDATLICQKRNSMEIDPDAE